jgi:ribonuclease HII
MERPNTLILSEGNLQLTNYKILKYEYKLIAGVDEVGRGPLAGPVVAAVVILPEGFYDPRIKDSKLIKSIKKREESEKLIKENAIAWGIGASSPQEIDQINILQATFLAMKRAIDSLNVQPEFLYVDGDKFCGHKNIPYECVIKGDSKIHSISAASILAKVHRDRLMASIGLEFPDYLWEKNAGYVTPEHISVIRNSGLTKHHRKSFCQNFI